MMQQKKQELDHETNDQYSWLEDVESERTKQWIAIQNNQTHSTLNAYPSRRYINSRIQEISRGFVGVPVVRNGRYFFLRHANGNEFPDLCVSDATLHDIKILIKGKRLFRGQGAVLSGWSPSPNGKLIAYGISTASNDAISLNILFVDSGKTLSDVVPAHLYPNLYAHSNIVWSYDNQGFWYSRTCITSDTTQQTLPDRRVYYHLIGDFYQSDREIFGAQEKSETNFFVSLSIDGKCIFINTDCSTSHGSVRRLYGRHVDDSTSFYLLAEGKDVFFIPFVHNEILYLFTNYKASNGIILSTAVSDVFAKNSTPPWMPVIKESNRIMQDFHVAGDNVFFHVLEDGWPRLYRYDQKTQREYAIPEFEGSSVSHFESELLDRPRDGGNFFVSLSSFSEPYAVYCIDAKTGKPSLWWRKELGIKSTFIIQKKHVESPDKVYIPVTLVFKKGVKHNSDNPTILSAYGGFGFISTPTFQEELVPFLECGGVYVFAHIRGGGERGTSWHQAALREKKEKSFSDFLCVAEWLIKNNYTNQTRLAAVGWSNGGLVTQVALTQRPELFAAVVSIAPLTDMLRYNLFPGGQAFVSEYGLSQSKKMYKILRRYSPFHNINQKRTYPATLIAVFENDDRVFPAHGYKMTAKLQNTQSNPPILLRVEQDVGHDGSQAVSNTIDLYSDLYTFIFEHLKLNFPVKQTEHGKVVC